MHGLPEFATDMPKIYKYGVPRTYIEIGRNGRGRKKRIRHRRLQSRVNVDVPRDSDTLTQIGRSIPGGSHHANDTCIAEPCPQIQESEDGDNRVSTGTLLRVLCLQCRNQPVLKSARYHAYVALYWQHFEVLKGIMINHYLS